MEESNVASEHNPAPSNVHETGGVGLDIRALNELIQSESSFVDVIKMEMSKVIIGQPLMVERLLIALLSNGHILL
jgi:MoxR-like ATPase